jgi:hypothetical protein
MEFCVRSFFVLFWDLDRWDLAYRPWEGPWVYGFALVFSCLFLLYPIVL